MTTAAFFAAALVCAAGCSHPFARAADDVTVSFEYGGLQREYLIHRPAGAGDPVPAVLVFHGGGGTAESMAKATGFDRLADSAGFAVVYPVGYEKSWNDGRGADTRAGAAGVDDLGFVSALIDRLVAQHAVDPTRVYATGISNGGMFTQNLGCHLADKLAAIAPVAGSLPAADESSCAPAHPLPVLEIHGTSDPIVPYTGGPVRITSGHHGGSGSSPVLSVDATQQWWRTADSCGPVTGGALPATTDDGTSVSTETADCANGTGVRLYSITGGGHTWPGGPQYLPAALVGKVSHQFDATQVIWRFFAAFRR